MNYLIDQLNSIISKLEDGKVKDGTIKNISLLLREITLGSEIPFGSLGKLTKALKRLSEYCNDHGEQSLAYEIVKVIDFVSMPRLDVGKTAVKGEANMIQEAQFK